MTKGRAFTWEEIDINIDAVFESGRHHIEELTEENIWDYKGVCSVDEAGNVVAEGDVQCETGEIHILNPHIEQGADKP